MALSLRGRELWPPGFVTSRRKLIGTFSLVCRRFTVCRPPRISPPPPSLIASSASIRLRWLASSQRTPLYLELEPSSSSAVSARMMSRVGRKPSRLSRISVSTKIAAIALSSLVPRP